jgi:uncharacterized protein (DUF4415 family)
MKRKNEMPEEYDFSKGKRGPVIPNKSKTRITIFIDTDILEWFRDEAEREGHGYQTEINQALRNYIRHDKRPIQEIVREAVRKELKIIKKDGFVKSRFPYSVHASTSSARTEYQ